MILAKVPFRPLVVKLVCAVISGEQIHYRDCVLIFDTRQLVLCQVIFDLFKASSVWLGKLDEVASPPHFFLSGNFPKPFLVFSFLCPNRLPCH